MKCSEALYEAMSEIDEDLLERSERPRNSFLRKYVWIPVMAAAAVILMVMPGVLPSETASDMKTNERDNTAEQAAAMDEEVLPENVTITEEAEDILAEEGSAYIRITVNDGDAAGTEALINALKHAGISGEMKNGAYICILTAEDLGRIVWPNGFRITLEAERERK